MFRTCSVCKQSLSELENFKSIWVEIYQKDIICSRICNNCTQKRIDKYNKHNRMTNNQLKIKVVNLMGGKCVCCGLTQWWILTLDHIIPIKNKHREATITLYYKILKDPELRKQFQLMCYGCNNSKNDNDVCRLNHAV